MKKKMWKSGPSLNKVHKKIEAENRIKEILNDPGFKKIMRDERIQGMDDAMDAFQIITALYLCQNFRCKGVGVKKFLDFTMEQIQCLQKDVNHLVIKNQEVAMMSGVNVIEYIRKLRGE